MKKAVLGLVLSLAVAQAFAPKPCEELKSEIAAKFDANGVKNYQLDIVAGDVKDQNVIGSCEAGTKKIIYSRDKAPSTANHPGASSK